MRKFKSEPLAVFVLPADAGVKGEMNFKGREARETPPPIMCPKLSVLIYDEWLKKEGVPSIPL